MPIPNQTALLAQIKSDLLARGIIPQHPNDNRTAFEIVSRLAWQLRAQGARLMKKAPAQNGYTIEGGPRAGQRYSHDSISFPDGWVDCLASAGPPANENRPSWGWTNVVRDPNDANLVEPFDPDAATVAPALDPQVVIPPPTQPVTTPSQPTAVDGDAARSLAQIAALLQEMRAAQDADRALQQQILDTLEGLRRDVNNAGKTLGTLVAGGGLGSIVDMFKR
jgi:hypothetical protein